MRRVKKWFPIIILFFIAIAISFVSYESYAWPWGHAKRYKPIRAKKYQYIRSHDLNRDGRVDAKDRLVWIDKHKGGVDAIIIEEQNIDIYEVMDFNNDGKVDKTEINRFYAVYDLNGNGVLEESEIETAAD